MIGEPSPGHDNVRVGRIQERGGEEGRLVPLRFDLADESSGQ
jgi:hypothetical protein